MPAVTPEEEAAEASLDAKLLGAFESEMAEQQAADTAVEAPEPEQEEAVTEPVAAANTEEPAADDRPRDEQGRFIPRNIEVDDPDVASFLDKYQGDPVKALRAAVHAERLIGQQGGELGELRQTVEELRSLVEQNQPQQPTYTNDQWSEWASGLNPTVLPQAVQQAYVQGNLAAANAALAELEDYDRGMARQLDRWMIQQDLARERQAAEQQDQALTSAWTDALSQFAQEHPDIDQFRDQMMQLVPQHPHMMRLLESDDPRARIEALDFYYTKAKARTSDTLSAAALEAETQQREQARQEKQNAATASATQSQQAPTPHEQWRQAFSEFLLADETSIQKGLSTD